MIFDINFSQLWKNLLPPNKRGAAMLLWGKVILTPLQWLRDLFFIDYANGFTGDKWNNIDTYNKGDRVRHIDRSVYEALSFVPANNSPNDPNSIYWLKIQELYIGAIERIGYNSQKLLLEFILNKWFETQFRQPDTNEASPNYYLPKSDIFIDSNKLNNTVFIIGESSGSNVFRTSLNAINFIQNSYSFEGEAFTIRVPIAVYNSLGATNLIRDAVIRALVDRYNLAGITYIITTY